MIAAFYEIEKQKDRVVLRGRYAASMKVIVWLSNLFLVSVFAVPGVLLYVRERSLLPVGIIIVLLLVIFLFNSIVMIGSGRHHTATFDFRNGMVRIKNIYPLFPWLYPTARIPLNRIADIYLSHYHIPSSVDQPEVNCKSFYIATKSKKICVTKRIDCSQKSVIDGLKELIEAAKQAVNRS